MRFSLLAAPRRWPFLIVVAVLSVSRPYSFAFTSTISLKTAAKSLTGTRLLMSDSLEQNAAPAPAESTTIASEHTFSGGMLLDPLLAAVLTREAEEDVANTTDALESIGGLLEASQGLQVWRRVLLKGRLPMDQDFTTIWPPEPLFSPLVKTMAELQLARFVKNHPETISAVLLTVVRITMEFARKTRAVLEEEEDDDDEIEEDFEDWEIYHQMEPLEEITIISISQEDQAVLVAEELTSGLIDEWGGLVEGVHALDILFGANHGLLDIQDASDDNNSDSNGTGFGISDGIWKHTGWRLIPQLQQELNSMPELKLMIKELGRRPMVEGSDAIHKFPPREANPQGAMGAQFDPFLPNTASGLTLSGSFSEMLPSEAMLLKGKQSLRRLFLAKKVESKLLSYERSGWLDSPSISKRTRRRRRPQIRSPSAPGGPILLCLDTSWSMSGSRERLSKAIILACVTAAHKQHRSCQVVAFSNKAGVIETGEIRPEAKATRRLLDFLGFSFGGGTDVTGALKHAMNVLGTDDMSAADVVLVTDGEIPDPPVPAEMMEDLTLLKQRTGMQIHGLLVGKKESRPLKKLCTKTHDFLVGYEEALSVGMTPEALKAPLTSSTILSAVPRGTSHVSLSLPIRGRTQAFIRHPYIERSRTALFARYSDDDGGSRTRSRKRKRGSNRDRFDDDDNDHNGWDTASPDADSYVDANDRQEEDPGSFNLAVQEAVSKVKDEVEVAIGTQQWSATELVQERNAKGSCWCYRDELKNAVDLVGEGLIEREEESRLVVLGMISEEHLLLLGTSGTGKSALGRRLSKLCGGPFFQRLLTRFTTPEEIYGPLSLKALENDEYKRCTEGFLPTSSVAFLDEIFKANSAILNTLLTILNERQFDNGAGGRQDCPIRCVVGASNEMPDSDELDALYDRFLLRKEVFPVSDDGLMQILSMPTPGLSSCDHVGTDTSSEDPCNVVFSEGLDSVVNALNLAANHVEMGEEACVLIRDLRAFLREDLDVIVSDRRLVKAARLLKISAASNGRSRVDPIDCLLLQYIAWQLPEQKNVILEWLWDHLTPAGNTPSAAVSQFRLLLDSIRQEASLVVRQTGGDVIGSAGARDTDIVVVQSLRSELSHITKLLERQAFALDRHIELLRQSMDHLWINPDEARAAQQQLLPKAEMISVEISQVLADALSLERALAGSSDISNEIRLSVVDCLWEHGVGTGVSFTDDEMNMSMREAKAKYDIATFRAWKRARKKANK